MTKNVPAFKETPPDFPPKSNARSVSYRWAICALLFFATTINYVDRSVLGLLAPVLQKEIGWDEIDYGNIVAAFMTAYAIAMFFAGRFVDKVGTKTGFSVSIVVWSIAAMGHALVKSVFGFGVARFALGLGESGNFPSSIKAVAEWFPKKERALATSLFNSGANIGALVVPLVVPWIALTWGWRAAFIFTGLLGFVWLVFWLWLYEIPERHKKVSRAEVEFIRSDQDAIAPEEIPWLSVLKYRQTWSFIVGKFLTDPFWWFYIYWLPKFLNEKYGLELAYVGLPLIIIYTMTSVGGIGGGWLSGALINAGWEINKGRKTVMLICALLVLPIVFVPNVSLWWAVFLLGLATGAHQGWSTNLFTTVSDMFPKKAVGSVVGIGGMAGSVGGILLASGTGYILQLTGSYTSLFVMAGSAYVLTLFVFHLLVPKIDTVILGTQ
jgi:MFS transporter, ACS family, hexuronate transporter